MTNVPADVRRSYGTLPDGWRLERLKFFATVSNSNVDKKVVDGELPIRLCNYTDVYYNDRIYPDMGFMERSASEDEIRRFALKSGQVLLTKDSESWLDIGIPALVTADMPDVVCGYHLAIIEPSMGLDGSFLAWLCRAAPLNDQFKLGANGVTRFGLGQYPLKNAFIALPPPEAQRRIARFLDAKTACIDALIAKKRALLERLAEKRQALITRAVTQGLDPDVPMKDSGIEWLGQVPAHWDVKPITYVATVGNGSTPRRDDTSYWEGGSYRWLNSSVVNLDKIIDASDWVTDAALKECHLPQIEPPAVLVGITGEGRTRGMASLLVVEATINQHLAYIKPVNGASDANYLRYVMTVAYTFLRNESDGGGSTKGAITCDQLGHMRVPAPPLAEQTAIASIVDETTSRMRLLETKVQATIDRFTEYRSALITAAVTGQLAIPETSPDAPSEAPLATLATEEA